MVVFGEKWLYTGKVAVFGQGGCVRAKVVVFVHIGCIPAKWFFLRARWLFLDKVVVVWQNRFYSGKSGLIWTKWLYSDKVVVFG